MKTISSIFILMASLGHAEMPWIEPPEISSKGHRVPTPDYIPSFPRDHGAHTEHGIEWWYWGGHLKAKEGNQEFGFQSTVFRVAGDPKQKPNPQNLSFGNQHLYLAHAALSDITNKEYLHYERLYRQGWQVQSSTQTLGLQVGGIQAKLDPSEDRQHLITRYPDGSSFSLTLKPAKPIVTFGDRGLSRKGSDPAAVSWYWSYTRLVAEGTLVHNGKVIPVSGAAWMDHEISSSQLGSDLAGWDWTCIQLDDGTEVKAYRLRNRQGDSDPWSSIYWINPNGEVSNAYSDQFIWTHDQLWKSPHTQLSYPTSVTISASHPTKGKVTYQLRPLLPDQEFRGLKGDNPYWEGACQVLDASGKAIGKAYLELAGYGGGLGARLN